MWYDLGETDGKGPSGHIYRSIASCYLWGYKVINEQFPQLDTDLSGNPVALGAKHRLIVFTSRADTEERLRQVWETRGYEVFLTKEQPIEEGDVRFRMLMLTATRLPGAEGKISGHIPQ